MVILFCHTFRISWKIHILRNTLIFSIVILRKKCRKKYVDKSSSISKKTKYDKKKQCGGKSTVFFFPGIVHGSLTHSKLKKLFFFSGNRGRKKKHVFFFSRKSLQVTLGHSLDFSKISVYLFFVFSLYTDFFFVNQIR